MDLVSAPADQAFVERIFSLRTRSKLHVLPWLHPSPQPNGISIVSAILTQLTAQACPFPKSCPFASSDLDSYLIPGSLSPPEPTTQTASRSVQRVCTAHRGVPIRYNGPPLPLKIARSDGDLNPV